MNVEIWSDVACPWCYIGKRRFESAFAHFAHRDPDIRSYIRGAGDEVPCRERDGVPRIHFFSRAAGP